MSGRPPPPAGPRGPPPPGGPPQRPPGPPQGQGAPPPAAGGRGPAPPPQGDAGRARGRAGPVPVPGPPQHPQQRPPPPQQQQQQPAGPPGSSRPGPPMPGPPGSAPSSRPPPQPGSGPPPPGARGPPPQSSQRPGPPQPQQAPPASGPPGPPGTGRSAYRADHRSEVVATRPQTQSSQESTGSLSVGARSATNGSQATSGGGAATPAPTVASSQTSAASASAIGRGVDRGGTRGVRARTEIVPTRPAHIVSKKGSGENPSNILANYFRVELKTGWTLLQYRVDFAPDIDETKAKKQLFKQHQNTLGNYMFDGTMLFTPALIVPQNQTRELMSKRDEDGAMFRITIRWVAILTPHDFHYISFFNIILRTLMEGLDLKLLGRNYYDPKAKILLNEYKLELWPGYVTSIRQHESNVLLCCEVSNKILRTDTVHQQLTAISQRCRQNFVPQAQKELLGCIVITRYNNRTYRVDDIDFNASPSSTFVKKDGSRISYIDYYKERYQLTIKDVKQPLIISQPRMADIRRGFDQQIILVPELCHLTGLSDEQRADFKLMKALGEYTRTVPEKRIETLLRFANRLHSTRAIQDTFNKWDMRFTPKLEQIKGTTLAPEKILKGGGGSCSYKLENADWGSEFRNFKLFNSTPCQKWVVLHTSREENEVAEFIQALGSVSRGMGFDLGPPRKQIIANNNASSYVAELMKVCEMRPQMIMAVVPNNKPGGPYDAIKKVLCIDRPIPSQVMTVTVLRKFIGKMNAVATKVAIQMATKVGSEPWGLEIPLKDLMVIGYDSFHDTAQKGVSVGAVVSSTNRTLTRFTSSCTFHKNQEELLDQLKTCISKAIRKYGEENKCLPGKIIIYRDGVGDGQIDFVREQEITAIKQIFKENNFNPKFTYIIVSKRVNSRFFKVQGAAHVNPPSGTVIDDVVTLPERYDFFLVSQSVRQGTVNPTSYNVIEDNSGLKPEHVQKLTYKLTHLYYNWPGTVRVPAPCQYAHKLAFLVGNSLHRPPSEQLEHLLYYL